MKSIPMLIIPQIPTITYIAFSIIGILPNIALTRLKSNKPIKPQFMAPTIVKPKAIF